MRCFNFQVFLISFYVLLKLGNANLTGKLKFSIFTNNFENHIQLFSKLKKIYLSQCYFFNLFSTANPYKSKVNKAIKLLLKHIPKGYKYIKILFK